MRKTMGLLGAMVCLMVGSPSARAQDEVQLRALMERALNSLVTIKIVAKTEMKFGGQGRDSESRMELQGVLVDSSGLVMLSNLPFNPTRMMAMFGGGGGGGDEGEDRFGMKVTPTDFKVLFGREEKEYSAYLVATDSKLDLAFIKIADLGGRKATPVDFAGKTVPNVGQAVLSVSRLAKGYDYAPYFTTSRISGAILKPRKAWVLDSPVSDFGMPIFTQKGEAVGILALISPGVQSDANEMDFSSMMRGGIGLRSFVVPSAVVQGVIEQAKLRAVAIAKKRTNKKK